MRVRLVWAWSVSVRRFYVKLRHCTAISRHGGGETRRGVRREKVFLPNPLWWKRGVAALVGGIDQLCDWPEASRHECRNDAANFRPADAGAATGRYGGTAGVVDAVWSSASIGRPKQRPRSSEARARVKRRAAPWWCMSMVGRARACRAWLWQAGRRACEERAVRRHSWCPSKACRRRGVCWSG